MNYNKSTDYLQRADMLESNTHHLNNYEQSLLFGNKYQTYNQNAPVSLEQAYNQNDYNRPSEPFNAPSISESFPYASHDFPTPNVESNVNIAHQSIDSRNSLQPSVAISMQSIIPGPKHSAGLGTNPTPNSGHQDQDESISNAWRLWSIGLRPVESLPVIGGNCLGSDETDIADEKKSLVKSTANMNLTTDVGYDRNTNVAMENVNTDMYHQGYPFSPPQNYTAKINGYESARSFPLQFPYTKVRSASGDSAGRYTFNNGTNNFLNYKLASNPNMNEYSFENGNALNSATESGLEPHQNDYHQASLRMPFYSTGYSAGNLNAHQLQQHTEMADSPFVASYSSSIPSNPAIYAGRKRAQSDSVSYSNCLASKIQSNSDLFDPYIPTRNKRFRSLDLSYTNDSTGSQTYAQPDKYYTEKGEESIEDTYLGINLDEYRYPIPWGPVLDQTLSMPLFDISPSDVGNPDARPRRQKARFDGDLYTPQWVRYSGQTKEGFCQHCKPGKWLQLKNSAYWYHVQFYHGISATSGHYYRAPLQMSTFENGIKGICHQCREVVAVCHAKKKDMALWFRHAHKCHVHHKPKSLRKR